MDGIDQDQYKTSMAVEDQKTRLWRDLVQESANHYELFKLELPRAWDPMGHSIPKGDSSP